MTATLRASFVVAVVALATWGEGGASAGALLVTHVLLAVAVAACVAGRGAGSVPSFRPTAAWLVFAALAGLGALAAPYAYAAWLVLVEILAFGSLVWLASGDPVALARRLTPACAVLAVAHGTLAIVQRVSGSPRPASTFLNPNHLAAWLVAAVLYLGGGLFDRSAPFRVRGLSFMGVGTALAGIVMTGSRGAALSLAIGITVLVVLTWSQLGRRARRGVLATAAVVVLVATTGVALRFRNDDDPYRFHRVRIWRAVLRGVASTPWLGTGPGQFAAAAPNMNFPLEDAPLRFERGFRTPHSDVLRAACEFGVPAALAALTAVGLAAAELFRRRHELTGVQSGAVAALVALLAQAVVDDLSTRPALMLTAAAFTGLLLSRPRGRPRTLSEGRVARCVAALVVLALGPGEVAGFISWEAVQTVPRGRLDARQLSRLDLSIAWNPMQPDLWARRAEHFIGDARSLRLEDYAAAREAAEHARRLQPADAKYARCAARVEATACLTLLPFAATRDKAARLYEEAEGLARSDGTIPLEAARFLLQAGEPVGARRAALRALGVEPRAVAPRLCLAQALLDADGPSGAPQARRLLDEAVSLAPRAGDVPTSSYDAALRSLDPQLAESLNRRLSAMGGP